MKNLLDRIDRHLEKAWAKVLTLPEHAPRRREMLKELARLQVLRKQGPPRPRSYGGR